VDAVTTAVGHETLLHQTYNVNLPPPYHRDANLVPGTRDRTASNILHALKPDLLRDHVPLAVAGDGNCFFRALCRQMYGSEDLHALLRLLTAVEIACFPSVYDTARPEYQSILGDEIYVPPYREILQTACTFGTEVEMIHLYAASAVIRRPIRSAYPVANAHLSAWDREVVGRNVDAQSPHVHILWSTVSAPVDMHNYTPNHFVLLYPVTNAATIEPVEYDGAETTADVSAQRYVQEPPVDCHDAVAAHASTSSRDEQLDYDGAESAAEGHDDDQQVKLLPGHKRGVVLLVKGYLFAKDKNVKDKR